MSVFWFEYVSVSIKSIYLLFHFWDVNIVCMHFAVSYVLEHFSKKSQLGKNRLLPVHLYVIGILVIFLWDRFHDTLFSLWYRSTSWTSQGLWHEHTAVQQPHWGRSFRGTYSLVLYLQANTVLECVRDAAPAPVQCFF